MTERECERAREREGGRESREKARGRDDGMEA